MVGRQRFLPRVVRVRYSSYDHSLPGRPGHNHLEVVEDVADLQSGFVARQIGELLTPQYPVLEEPEEVILLGDERFAVGVAERAVSLRRAVAQRIDLRLPLDDQLAV